MTDTGNITEWLSNTRNGMTDERLSEVFSLVSDQLDRWKDPFDVHVPKTAATYSEIETAVIWYAGGAPDIYDEGDNWFVSGAGYYEWVGA